MNLKAPNQQAVIIIVIPVRSFTKYDHVLTFETSYKTRCYWASLVAECQPTARKMGL